MLIGAVSLALPFAAVANEKDMEKKTDSFFQKMDSDGNGTITKAESDAFGNKMFKEADANSDGKISKEEFREHKKQEHAKWKGSKDSDSSSSESGVSGTEPAAGRMGAAEADQADQGDQTGKGAKPPAQPQ